MDLFIKDVDTICQKCKDEKADTHVKKRILLAEDNELNLLIEKTMLEAYNLEVVCAENGLSALNQFMSSQEGFFDAVLTDIHMPVMDGLETAKGIRSLNRKDASSVPIIALTASDNENDKQAELAAGITDHITKPIMMELLYEKIKKYIKS